MTSKGRLKKIFNFEIPDRIPMYDLFVDVEYPEDDFDIKLLDCSNVAKCKTEDKFNMLTLMDPFEDLSNAFGLELLLEKIGKDPEGVFYEFKKSTAKTLKRAGERIADTQDIDGIWLWADMAYSKGTFFSESFYERHLFPLHKEICSYFAEHNLPVVMHSDGNLNNIFGYLLKAGFRGLHPLESASGMDLAELVTRCKDNDNMVFFANFNLDLLRHEDIEDIFETLVKKLDIAKKTTRYVFGFESPITSDVDLSKYKKVLEFVKEYGAYSSRKELE